MSATSKIEWTDATWNPIRAMVVAPDGSVLKWGYHCEAVSPGCANCYAETMNLRGFPAWGTKLEYKPGYLQAPIPPKLCAELKYEPGSRLRIYLDQRALQEPLHWKKPRRVFVCSMTDLFADFVQADWIDQVFAVMALAPQHTFQVLTKREERMREYAADQAISPRLARKCVDHVIADKTISRMLQDSWPVASIGDPDDPSDIVMRHWPLPNVWLGVSAEDQTRADERIPDLLATPAEIRFVSAEPLLGPVDLSKWLEHLDWVIAGGESGPKARPMHPDWVRAMRDQCVEAGVPFFFKQWGEWADSTDHQPAPLCVEDFIFRADGEVLGAGGRHRGTMHGLVDGDWRDRGGAWMSRIGKARAGRVLDGRTWDQMPGDM